MAMFRLKWNSIGLPENPFLLILFFLKRRTRKFQKYQRAILVSKSKSIKDILPILPKTSIFDQIKINLGEKTEKVTLVWESTLFFYNHTGKLGWSFNMLKIFPISAWNYAWWYAHFMVWHCLWCEHCSGLF